MREHFVMFSAGFAAVYIPFSLISSLAPNAKQAGLPPAQVLMKMAGFGAFTLFVLAICLPFAQLLVTTSITDIYLGQPTDLGSAARRSRKTYLSYLGTTMLAGLLMLGGMFLCVAPGIYFMVCCALVGPVAVVEGIYGSRAISRSRALVKGYFWRTLGMFVLMSLVVTLLSGAAQAAFAFIPVLGPALTGVVQAVGAAYSAVVIVVLYVDLRCRHEDFDVQLLASQVAASSGGGLSGGLNVPAT